MIDVNQEREAAIDQLTTAKNTVWGIVAILAHRIDVASARRGEGCYTEENLAKLRESYLAWHQPLVALTRALKAVEDAPLP
jgi:hypothetical protein